MKTPFLIGIFLAACLCTSDLWAKAESLEEALKDYQQIADRGGWSQVPDGPSVHPGESSERIPFLRRRLAVTGDLKKGGRKDVLDGPLEEALKRFQDRHGLEPDGVLGAGTVKALNVPVTYRIRQIESNLKRERERPQDLGSRYVQVNIPDFRLSLMEEGREAGFMKVVVGLEKDWQTPMVVSRITHLVLNPKWYMPSSILEKEVLKKIQDDPQYLEHEHLKVFRKGDEKKEALDPATVDWAHANPEDLLLIQDEGEGNALGQVKFMFPNKFDIYLHDTPQKQFFQKRVRAFSHGCVRVEKPMELVDFLTKEDARWNLAKIQAMIRKEKNQWLKLSHPVAIYVIYITAWVDGQGRVNFRDDIYTLD